MPRIGLVAGEGKLPIVFARLAKSKGDTVIGFGLKGVTDEKLAESVDKMHWLDWGHLEKGLLLLAMERIRKIVMLGKLKKELFFNGAAQLDSKAKGIIEKVRDKKDYVLLNEITAVFSKLGMQVIDAVTYLKDLIPQKGTLTKREPSKEEWEDINYGKDVAKSLSGFDIGQTLVLKSKTVIAVEAMEGTDETIARAGILVKGGCVVVKVARPNQDMRFDVPLVGLSTVEAMARSGCNVLALEADKTILMDREEIIRFCDEKNIALVVI